jgi:hypothetical protein
MIKKQDIVNVLQYKYIIQKKICVNATIQTTKSH